MIVVSHDRYFLNRVANKIFELHAGRIEAFPGNFDAYVRLRGERYELALKTWQAQQEYIEKQEEYIRRVNYGQLSNQAQSRQKQLDKLERVDRPTRVEGPKMHFGEVRRTGDVVVEARELSKAYDASRSSPTCPLFQLKLRGQRRLGIMGPNWLRQVDAPQGSARTGKPRLRRKPHIGHLVEFGYCDQHLATLPAEETVIRAVWPHEDATATDQRMRDLLARFGLVGDQIEQKVGQLSGGEKSRAALAKLVADGVNVLVLDEPTNHLDIWACEALEQALLAFEGTTLVVSHDRWFLNRVVDLLLVYEGAGEVEVIYGNYDMYERMRAPEARISPGKGRRNTNLPCPGLRPRRSTFPEKPSGNGGFRSARPTNSKPTSPGRRRACAKSRGGWRRRTSTATATRSRKPPWRSRRPRPVSPSFTSTGRRPSSSIDSRCTRRFPAPRPRRWRPGSLDLRRCLAGAGKKSRISLTRR